MKKIVLLYWPKGGNVEKSAKNIYSTFDENLIDIYDVESFDMNNLEGYDYYIMGSSTVGAEHWEDADSNNLFNRFFRQLEEHDLKGKKVALFGLGDQILYPAHYVDGLGILKEEVDKINGSLVGQWPTEGYSFTDSEGVDGDKFFGLALDEDNEDDKSEARIKKWVEILKKEFI